MLFWILGSHFVSECESLTAFFLVGKVAAPARRQDAFLRIIFCYLPSNTSRLQTTLYDAAWKPYLAKVSNISKTIHCIYDSSPVDVPKSFHTYFETTFSESVPQLLKSQAYRKGNRKYANSHFLGLVTLGQLTDHLKQRRPVPQLVEVFTAET